jgi:hypothetical protein
MQRSNTRKIELTRHTYVSAWKSVSCVSQVRTTLVSFLPLCYTLTKSGISESANPDHVLCPTLLPLIRQIRQIVASMASGIEAAHASIQDVTGYAFHNNSLLEGALDTSGFHSIGSNERLAVLGDSQLKEAILDDWYPTATTKGMSATK